MPQASLGALVAAVSAGRKYRNVCQQVIASIGARELAHRGDLKAAIKATKNKLHQVGAAYVESPHYAQWLGELQQAVAANHRDAVSEVCTRAMATHASSRERLPILEQFYTTTLRSVAPVRSVLDLACGLNPLAIPWMPLAEGATYYAYDIYEDLMSFVRDCLGLFGHPGEATATDVLSMATLPETDVAYLLKSLPCLEQLDKSAVVQLLERIPARHLLVTFPLHTLGGCEVGMLAHYEVHLRELLGSRNWALQRTSFENELAFLITKG